jgi:hypothetical protein
MVVRLDLRQLVENGSWQFALFEIEDMVESQKKAAARFLFRFVIV